MKYLKDLNESHMKRFVAKVLLNQNALDDKWNQVLLIEYLYELAEHHDPNAYIMIGDLYEHGLKPWIPQDICKAIKYYVKAIRADILYGYECIGMLLFYRGKNDDDYRTALNFFLAVSTHDGKLSFGGYYALGEMYRQGLYVKQDTSKAKRCYEKIIKSDLEYRNQDEYYKLAQKQYNKLLNKESGD